MADPALWWAWQWTAVHGLWVAASVGAGAVLLRRATRRASPRSRYALALAVLAVLAAVPAAVFAVVHARAASSAAAAKPTAELAAAALPAVTPVEPMPLDVRAAFPAAPPVAAAAPAAPRLAWLAAVVEVLPSLWLAGIALGGAWTALGAAAAHRLARRSRRLVPAELHGLDVEVAAALGLRRRVRFAVSPAVASPVVLGALRPLVVLPAAVLRGWSRSELEMVLLHELAHVRRRDNLVSAAQRAVECLLLFHPAVRWVSRWARLEREQCCDAIVVAHTGEPTRYVRTLLALAAPPAAAARVGLAMSQSPLVDRVRALLQQESKSMNVPRSVSLATLGLLAFSGLVLGTQAQVPPAPSVPSAPHTAPAPPAPPEGYAPPAAAAPLGAEDPRAIPGPAPVPMTAAPRGLPSPADAAPPPRAGAACTACHVPHAPHASHAPRPAVVSCPAIHADCARDSATPPPTAVPTPAIRTHVVQPGDPSRSIARAPGLPDGERLGRVHPGLDAVGLQSGQQVHVPPAAAPLPGRPSPPAAPPSAASPSPSPAPESVDARIERLEAMVRELQAELDRLRQQRPARIAAAAR